MIGRTIALLLAATATVLARTGGSATTLAPPSPCLPSALRIASWNVGYAGLGQGQNFKRDGGTDWRPDSRAVVQDNLTGITAILPSLDADVLLLQELARPSFVNHRVDVLGAVRDSLAAYEGHFVSQFKTRLVPPPLNNNVGLGVFLRQSMRHLFDTRPLPREPLRLLYRRPYRIAYAELPDPQGAPWLIGNVHLSAFDKGGVVRLQQLAEVLAFAEARYAEGHSVVIGGDWNMRLTDARFAHTTDERYLFWLMDLPAEQIPPGWKMVADPRTPSVRTVHQAYEPGANYTTVIDGFLLSPDLTATAVATRDLQFEHADHQPVVLEVQRSPCEAPGTAEGS